MSSIQCLGKIKSFNPVNNEIVFRVSFFDEKGLGDIEKSINEDSIIKLRFTKSRKDALKTYEQLKRVWNMFTYIVLANDEVANRQNVEAVEEYCRLNIFPRRQIYNSLIEKIVKEKNQIIDEPIRLSEQTIDELNLTMKKIELTWPEVFSDNNWQTKFEEEKIMQNLKDIEMFLYKKDDNGEDYAVMNPIYEKAVHHRLYAQADIPEFYWDINWENYIGDKSLIALKHARKYSENFSDERLANVSLYLHSPIKSTQKTAVACNICKDLVKKNLKVKFVSAAKLIDTIMKTQGFSSNRHSEEYLDELLFCDLIVIDDIYNILTSLNWQKKESNTQIISAWDSFLRPVLVSKTRIIMTSNTSIEMIKDKYEENMWELIDRNFIQLDFNDKIKEDRKESFNNVLEEI